MSIIANLLNDLIEVTEYDLAEIEIWLHHRRHHHFKPVAGRFAGMFRRHHRTGDFIVATQTVPLNTPSTAPLVFTDASGATGPGPVGTVSASDPSVSVSLSADGQSANVTLSAVLTAPATLTWTDPSGVVPDFSVEVTDQATFSATAGSFGTFAPGTTA